MSLANHPRRSTRPTLSRSLSIEAAPTAVLISVGHSEHSMTTIAEITKLFASSGSALVIVAETTIVTIGSQASGLTGFMICTSGLIAALTSGESPHTSPIGTAASVASTKPSATVLSEVRIWSGKVGAPDQAKSCTAPGLPAATAAALRVSCSA